MRLLQDRYSDYFLDTAPFNADSTREDVYLIVGRRGSGKTALAHHFGFQTAVPGAVSIDVDEPAAFQDLFVEAARRVDHSREIAIPRLAQVWDLVVWSVIFRELSDQDPRIKAAGILGQSAGKVSRFVRDVIKHILSKLVRDEEGVLASGMESLLANRKIEEGRKAVLELTPSRPIIVALDTLEQYDVRNEEMMRATAALVQCAATFNRDYAPRGVHLKVFISGEVFPYLKEGVILNPLKSVKSPLHLLWRPRDLLRMITWRFHRYLLEAEPARVGRVEVRWESYADALEKMWRPCFGRVLTNARGLEEETFPYVLRHTQMRPRQLIILCNAIARRAMREGRFLSCGAEDIVPAVREGEVDLANEVINAYSSLYPNVGRIVDALMGAPMTFRGKELDRRAHASASHWPAGDYSPANFRQLLAELGIVGRVRHGTADFVAADFEYALSDRLPLDAADDCVVHPMFFRRLNIQTTRLRVFPFPDHPEYEALRIPA